MGDLLDWACSIVAGAQTWHDSTPQAWDADVDAILQRPGAFDAALASAGASAVPTEQLFQGPSPTC